MSYLKPELHLLTTHDSARLKKKTKNNNTETSVTAYLDEQYADLTKDSHLGVAAVSDPQFKT